MTANTLAVALRALAVWRLSHMLMYEAGPWNIIIRLREYFGVRHDPDGTPVASPDGSVFSCFLCFSIWTGALVSSLPSWWLQPFALSALAIWAERWYRGSR